MPKTSRRAGPSNPAGPVNPRQFLAGGTDYEVPGRTSDIIVGGSASFGISPTVPNPAPLNTPGAAASIGEVKQLIATASSGFIGSMGPKTSLAAAVSNSSAETSLLNADFSVPRLVEDAVFQVTAGGLILNTTGSAVTATFRLRNQTDNLVLLTAAVTLASDAIGQRAWRLAINGEGNTFLSTGPHTVGHLAVQAGNTDPLQQSVGQTIQTQGTDPQSWRVTAQLSVASANATITVYSAQISYAFPGA